MANFSAPLVRFSTSAANMRVRRSRKSPSARVPPGNWCEIFSEPVWAQADCSHNGLVASAARTDLRVIWDMSSYKGLSMQLCFLCIQEYLRRIHCQVKYASYNGVSYTY